MKYYVEIYGIGYGALRDLDNEFICHHERFGINCRLAHTLYMFDKNVAKYIAKTFLSASTYVFGIYNEDGHKVYTNSQYDSFTINDLENL